MSEGVKKQPERRKFQAIKGVRDILPPESALWNRVEQIAREVFATYNFAEIRPPIFEATELFARSIGADTDVVSKEMFSFEDHDHIDLAHVRSSLLIWELEYDEANGLLLSPSIEEVLAYYRNVTNFAEAFEELWESSEVPHTPSNDTARQRLSELIREMTAKVEDFRRSRPTGMRGAKEMFIEQGMFKELLKQLEPLVAQVYHALQAIGLGTEVTLRPEATASVCRAYIEHGKYTQPGNVKLYYIGPMFRRERPQKGRFRQFYQIGAEVLGQSDAPAIDAEVIEMLMEFFKQIGLAGTTLYINSIGCQECRPAYVALLRDALTKVKDKLGADSQRRIETNPLRVLDSKLPEEQAIIEKLPRIADHLCADCRDHFARVQEELKQRGIAYEVNWRLVRGLDYYMRTTFEITAPGLGAQNAVCGGGRYDGLVELLGGPPTKGIGFAIGTDRVILALQEAGKGETRSHLDVFVAWMGVSAYPAAMRLARRLRAERFAVEIPPEEAKLKKSLGLADKLGARYALIIGEDEVASGQFTLKRLSDGDQKKLTEPQLLEHLKSAG